MALILNRNGDQCDETGRVLIPYEVLRQRILNQAALRNDKPKPLMEYDEEAQRLVETVMVQGDPGDER